MYARKCLDIGWGDLAAAAARTLRGAGRGGDAESDALSAAWGGATLATLSVRSGFHAMLSALRWPAGDEVLVSAITIPHMVDLLHHHGLVAVPVELELSRCAPRLEALQAAITPRTRALLVAHLFGARLDLDPLIALAHARGLEVWEDCAQAFAGESWRGHPGSAVVMWSFGTIKTATAIGGALLSFRDPGRRDATADILNTWREQPQGDYLKRLGRAAALQAASAPSIYGPLTRACEAAGVDYDRIVMAASRGFPGADLIPRLEARPSPALLATLRSRLATWSPALLQRRRRNGDALRERVGPHAGLGWAGDHHTWWLVPLLARDPDALVRHLRRIGFDATRASTSLAALDDAGRGRCPEARDAMRRVVYAPVDGPLTDADLDALARAALERCIPVEARPGDLPTPAPRSRRSEAG